MRDKLAAQQLEEVAAVLENNVTEPSGLTGEAECPTPHEDMVRAEDDEGTGRVESPCYTCGAAV